MTSKYISIGKLGAPYGVQGWLKVQSFTELGASIFDYKPWYVSTDEITWLKLTIDAHKVHGKGFIVKLKGYNSPETARKLTGMFIGIPRDQLPALAPNEYYWTDVIGLTVINQDQQILGQVAYLITTGSNDVLVVKGKQEIAIPCLFNEVIIAIDLIKKEIHVNWEI